jgi:hypothetical protein
MIKKKKVKATLRVSYQEPRKSEIPAICFEIDHKDTLSKKKKEQDHMQEHDILTLVY